MPTAAKLVAAIAFALLGFFTAELIKPLLPEGTQFGFFREVCAGIGALCGWRVMGVLTGRTYRAAVESGLRTMLTMVFWCVLLLAIYHMVLESMKRRYDGPIEAIQAIFSISLDYLQIMVDPGVIAALLLGGMLGGVLTEWASRRWR